jgi:hypothetical protein
MLSFKNIKLEYHCSYAQNPAPEKYWGALKRIALIYQIFKFTKSHEYKYHFIIIELELKLCSLVHWRGWLQVFWL